MSDKIKLEFKYTNQFGDEFVTSRIVDEDFCDLGEMELFNETYKNFLNNVSFVIDTYDEVVILKKGEHICHCNDDELDGGYK